MNTEGDVVTVSRTCSADPCTNDYMSEKCDEIEGGSVGLN